MIVCGLVAGLVALSISGTLSPQGLVPRSNRGLILATWVAGWSLYLLAGMTDQALGAALSWPAVGCAVRSLVAGTIGFLGFVAIWRKTDPWSPRTSGGLMGAAAGCIATAGVGVPCAAGQGGHLLVGHWLAVPVLALVGAAVSRRILAP